MTISLCPKEKEDREREDRGMERKRRKRERERQRRPNQCHFSLLNSPAPSRHSSDFLSCRKPFLQSSQASHAVFLLCHCIGPSGFPHYRIRARMVLVASDRNPTQAGFSPSGHLLAPQTQSPKVEQTLGAQAQLLECPPHLGSPLLWGDSALRRPLPQEQGSHQHPDCPSRRSSSSQDPLLKQPPVGGRGAL